MRQADPIQTFLLEAEDLLAQVEEVALEVSRHPGDADAVNRLFRAFHTIKGSGAMFGFEAVAAFTHRVESVLDRVRDGSLGVSEELIRLILASADQIKLLLWPDAPRESDAPKIDSIVAGLDALSKTPSAPAIPGDPAPQAPAPAALAAPVTYRIRFRPPLDVAASGLDPVCLLRELRELGPCTVEADTGAVPPLEELAAEKCHLSWNIALTTDRGPNAVRDVFIFVEDGSELVIEPVASLPPAPVANPPAPVRRLAPAAVPPEPAPVAGPRPASAVAAKSKSGESVVRVPSERLDRLVALVGEMVMNQSRLTQAASRHDDPDLASPVEDLERLVAEMRDNVLGIRMMPIGSTFGRFKRLVHDLSHELGKEIDLVTEGAETELDKTVLDRLGDPLVHLIRNSIDHGIEMPDERERCGKPRCGTIRLTASHEGSHVVVRVQDDGRGLDAAVIRAKAIERRLVAADAVLSQKDVFDLVFLPGFSTAKQVTNVSGRGVGMDAVRKQIDALRGGIHLASKAGAGTTIDLSLPLTLAIIDGMLVEIDRTQFIIPMAAVSENVELHAADRGRNNGRNLVSVRGELVSYIRLRELFSVPGQEPAVEKIVLVHHDGQRFGLVVDRVLGSHQTVIQSLGRYCRNIKVVAGATIMGDGRVALILDLNNLIRLAEAGTLHDGAPPCDESRLGEPRLTLQPAR